MNENIDRDQADEELLTPAISDEALEAAAFDMQGAARSWGGILTIDPECFGC
jgi:hypothetical protein